MIDAATDETPLAGISMMTQTCLNR